SGSAVVGHVGGEIWASGCTQLGLGNLVAPPNAPYYYCSTGPAATAANGFGFSFPGVYGLASYHPGGTNVAMCDGSVRFLKNSISMPPFGSLASIAQGEVISSDSY